MTGGEDDEAPLFDPMADVLFGAASLLILALILIMPAVGRPVEPASTARRSADAAAYDSRIYADAGGVTYGAALTRVPLDGILDDPGFAAWLAEHRAAGASVELIVGADGGEAAFVAEPVIARAGITELAVARLDRSCGASTPAQALTRCFGARLSEARP